MSRQASFSDLVDLEHLARARHLTVEKSATLRRITGIVCVESDGAAFGFGSRNWQLLKQATQPGSAEAKRARAWPASASLIAASAARRCGRRRPRSGGQGSRTIPPRRIIAEHDAVAVERADGPIERDLSERPITRRPGCRDRGSRSAPARGPRRHGGGLWPPGAALAPR